MAKLYNNNKNFLIIEMTREEASSLGFGITVPGDLNFIICGSCNDEIKEEIYYIAGINEVFCKECLEDYIKGMNHCVDYDSLRYEVNHFNVIAQKLGMDVKAAFTADKKIVITNV